MAKKLQIMLSDEAELIMKNLKVKQTKSFFTSMAIKHFSMTKEGKNFLKDIESFEPKSSNVKFKNFNDVDSASRLTNKTIATTLDDTRERCKLGKDEFFWFDIVGLSVFENDENLGVVESIERYGPTDYLCIKTDEKLVRDGMPKSFLLPYQDRFVSSICLEDKRVNATYAKDILSES